MNLIETIKFENGKFSNLELHQHRMNNSRKVLWGCTDDINLTTILQAWTLKTEKFEADHNLYKCRIIYNQQIQNIEILPYKFPKLNSLKIIYDDTIDYNFKYQNRDLINKLYSLRGDHDDILIVKNGLITDTSYCNVLFYNGKHWLTPEKPLLKGIQRQYLVNNEIVETANIMPSDIQMFKKLRLINAMISFEENMDISINQIQ